MSEELFPSSEVAAESPRLKWMNKHGVTTRLATDGDGEPEWYVWSSTTRMSAGPTEDDAIAAWARKNGVLLWHEEAFAKPKGNGQ